MSFAAALLLHFIRFFIVYQINVQINVNCTNYIAVLWWHFVLYTCTRVVS